MSDSLRDCDTGEDLEVGTGVYLVKAKLKYLGESRLFSGSILLVQNDGTKLSKVGKSKDVKLLKTSKWCYHKCIPKKQVMYKSLMLHFFFSY